jgi:hypothetical protein
LDIHAEQVGRFHAVVRLVMRLSAMARLVGISVRRNSRRNAKTDESSGNRNAQELSLHVKVLLSW